MPPIHDPADLDPPIAVDLDLIRPWLRLSGRYVHNGGASTREGAERGGHADVALRDPAVRLDRPVYLPEQRFVHDSWLRRLRFTLHVDIDGTDPLQVVSGTVARGLTLLGRAPVHFVGRVQSNTFSGGVRSLVVEDFSFTWPGSSLQIDRLEVELTGSWFASPTAEVTFVDSARGRRLGPYRAPRTSPHFREVEFEVDYEEGAVTDVEPYHTQTHPDRPADLPAANLDLETVFAKAGVKVTRSPGSGTVVASSEAGADERWTNQELHDSMERHWSRFANVPQWKMWVFLARLGTSDSLGGIMFDANIGDPGGVDRQGTAIFTRAPFFHSADGTYPQANPPAAEAAERELFFNLVHEIGHGFNLAHSFQKTLGTPWDAPAWMPLTSDDQALSWMNYPERPSPGTSAKWFYDRFRFRFDDNENLFLRHAPASFVQMGNETWFVNHGRVQESSLDRRLELKVRARTETVAFGESVFVELRLRNAGDEPLMAHPNLDPADGLVELAITGPDGERRPFVPPVHTRSQVPLEVLAPDERRYEQVNLTVGMFGFPFKQPGAYRIEAAYHNIDGGTAAAVLHIHVAPPASYEEERVLRSLFDVPTGLTLLVGGTRVLEDVNERLDWVVGRVGEQHPAAYYLKAARALPLAAPFKLVEPGEEQVRVLDPEPSRVVEELEPFVAEPEEAADAVGHIGFRAIVDTFTDCAARTRRRKLAREAQQAMLGLFEARGVIAPVVEEVRERIEQLR